MTTSSSDVADEEQYLFTEPDNDNGSEEQTLERREQSPQSPRQWVANEEPPFLKISVKECTNVDGKTTS